MAPIFGYGSLILPTSLVSRFENVDPTLEKIYSGEIDETVRDDALSKWEERRDRITYVPAKLWGFRRYYALESDRGGMMLETIRTDDPDDWINGVLISGLSEDEERQIAESESVYEYLTVEEPRLEFYVDPAEIDGADPADFSAVRIFASDKSPEAMRADAPRNRVYHSRIRTGIMMIGEMYGADVAKAFYDDFRETTYETAYDADDPTAFNTVAENDRLSEDSEWQPNA